EKENRDRSRSHSRHFYLKGSQARPGPRLSRNDGQASQAPCLQTDYHMSSKKPLQPDAPSEMSNEEPDRFPLHLLQQPPGARQEYFEQQCLIEHPRLLTALDATLQAICSPGEGASMRRPGTMVLVIGPR